MFTERKITVGVTGGIAAYKAADIVSWLSKNGAGVQVAMTKGACAFIDPLVFKTLSKRPVAVDIFDQAEAYNVPHLDCAACDLFVVVPATANILAKAAHGLADDLLSAALLATKAPVLFAPAMHCDMYTNPVTQENIAALCRRGWRMIAPDSGVLACGAQGVGRLASVQQIQEAITEALLPARPLQGKRVLVTAGPTYEYLDPVRFIGNRSSGKMGYALAEAACRAGADVTLISGPCALATPAGVQRIDVISGADMAQACFSVYDGVDIVIMAAAVADYRPEEYIPHKQKKGAEKTVRLVENQDILAALGQERGDRLLIGFAAETENLAEYARIKLRKKNLDMIIANDVSQKGAGFDGDTNIITSIVRGETEDTLRSWPLMSKKQAAEQIIELITGLPRFPYIGSQKEEKQK
ncbi:MAG: bifunctional phosphopantothenoylcysteine decarboxylase/phosphopantothenate--cysteine ligase CoaBC [Firmicutes bacterium]|nr:bifunctional phosphopantothenoylcysteine decarboxylase/phosphopantothenate--cysteine ligase CoaBC [Bacillota bacterium]